MSSHTTHTTRGWARRGSILLGLALGLALGSHTLAAETDDLDGDGVTDAVDACPTTEPDTIVDAAGCAICACDMDADGFPWASRREYVTCVLIAVRTQRETGQLLRPAARAAKRSARKSTCGSIALTRCCIYRDFDDDDGTCRLMSEDACDELDDRLWERDGEANDEGPGSCAADPCAW